MVRDDKPKKFTSSAKVSEENIRKKLYLAILREETTFVAVSQGDKAGRITADDVVVN